MTISTTTSRVDYTGNGVTTAFAVPFVFFGASELTVIERVTSTGVETTKALSTHYTVTGGDGSTGTVTAVTAPASTVTWTILRSTARTQSTDYVDYDPFPAASHERAVDRLTAITQEIERDIARSVRIAATDTGTATLPTSVSRASKFAAYDGSGNPIAVAGAAGEYPVSAFMATVLDDTTAAAAKDTLGISRASVTPQMFGAVGDGTTDDSAAFIAALAAANVVVVPWTSAGYNLGTTTVTVADGKHLIGDGMPLLKSTTTTTCIALTGYGNRSSVQGLRFDMTSAGASSAAIRFRTDLAVVWRALLRNLRFDNCVTAIASDATNYIVEVTIEDVLCTRPRGRQMYLAKSRGFLPIRDFFVDCTLSATPLVTWESIRIENFIGVELSRVDVVGQSAITTQVYDAGAVGIVIDGDTASSADRFLWLNRVRVESSMGPGIQITDVQFVFAIWLESYAALGTQLYFEDCGYIQGANVYARGATDQAGGAASAHGTAFSGCSKISIANCDADLCTGSGVLLHNTTDALITNVRSFSNDGYGVAETGTSNRNTIQGAHLAGNVTGTHALVGAQSALRSATNGTNRLPDTAICAFHAHKNGTSQTSIASATFTAVTFGTAALNAGGHYSTSTSRWTPPVGEYLIGATIGIEAGLVDQAELSVLLYKNGASIAQHTERASGTGNPVTLSILRPVTADGDDYFEVYVYLAGAGTKDIAGNAVLTSFFGSPL